MGQIDRTELERLEKMLQAGEHESSRIARVRDMSDADLSYAQRILSDGRTLEDNVWLPLIEGEMRARGLIRTQ